MSDVVQMFSTEAYDLLQSLFEVNEEIYQANCPNEDFWLRIMDVIKTAKLRFPAIVQIRSAELRKKVDEPLADETWQDVGLKFYRSFGKLDDEIIQSPQFWSFATHRWMHRHLLASGRAVEEKQYFVVYPRGLNSCLLSRYYMTTLWTDEMLDDNNKRGGPLAGKTLEECLVWTNEATDLIARMIDRRPFSSPVLRNCVIEILVERLLAGKRRTSRSVERAFFVAINRLYGGALMEILSPDELKIVLLDELEKFEEAERRFESPI